jgi:hypothetical protein
MKGSVNRASRSLVSGPSEQDLRRCLGRTYSLFDRVAHPTPTASGEWRCYQRDAPLVWKVLEGKHTLYYVRPARGGVLVSLLLTRRACEAAQERHLPARVRRAIAGAQTFPEGRAVRLELHRLSEAADVWALLALKVGAS